MKKKVNYTIKTYNTKHIRDRNSPHFLSRIDFANPISYELKSFSVPIRKSSVKF